MDRIDLVDLIVNEVNKVLSPFSPGVFGGFPRLGAVTWEPDAQWNLCNGRAYGKTR